MNIYQTIAAVMSDIGAVGKDSKNAQQGFMFRGIDAVMNALAPALQKNKLFIVPTILEQTREERTSVKKDNYGNEKTTYLIYSVCKIKYTFYAEDGSFIEATVIGEGMDTGDKATNKAMSIAYKYACFQVFCIPTEEMVDPDKECHEVEPKAKPQKKEPETKKAQEKKQEPKQDTEEATPEVDPHSAINILQAKALRSRLKHDGIEESLIFKLYKVDELEKLTILQYTNINEHWDKIVERAKKA